MKGLYIHIPFCDHICTYCDFLKFIAKDELKVKYINSLCKELELKLNNGSLNDIDTIYIGGGTPTSLSKNLLEQLLLSIDKICEINNIKEYTIETNPSDVYQYRDDLLELLTAHHINRLSLGVQSFSNQKLKEMGRNHNKKIAIEAIKLAKKYINNISIDLIFGFSKDTFPKIRNDINIAKDLKVTHISCYSLILEDKSILKYQESKGFFNEMDPDIESRMYYKIVNHLNNNGYPQYEISNFGKPKYESLHNKKYWESEFYEACGIGASSYCLIDNTHHRIKNITKINDYIKALSSENVNLQDIILEDLIYDKQDQMDMDIDLSLRLNKGINKSKFVKKYGKTIYTVYPNILKLEDKGLLIETSRHIKIADKYRYLHTSIVTEIIS